MTEGSMTGRPNDGVNERDDHGVLPGERPADEQVGADPAGEPRSAEAPMSDDVTHVPGEADGPGGKRPGMSDATGPTG